MFVKVYASGTNVQRLAKASKSITGVVYTAYSELEHSEPGIIKRKFFQTEAESLRLDVATLNPQIMPSWTKIWDKPLANSAFISKLFESLTGGDTLRPELNLSNMADIPVDCFMLLVSADKAPMKHIKSIAERAVPDWHVKVLNGDHTTNRKAEDETKTEINEAKIAGKKGVIIIANQMGSRSYSVSEIQATVIAYDRGSVDATAQKTSRCLTPGKKYDGTEKQYGIIVDLSFDPNRSENIERLLIEEAVMVQRAQNIDFTAAVRFVLSSIDMFKMNEYGNVEEVDASQMFSVLGNNENLLRVADISVDVVEAVESGVFDLLASVKTSKAPTQTKKTIVGEGVVNAVTPNKTPVVRALTNTEKRRMEKIINEAIHALNMSATSVFFLAGSGDSYRECLTEISKVPEYAAEFEALFGIDTESTKMLLSRRVLNEPILDVIVQNSQEVDNLFA